MLVRSSVCAVIFAALGAPALAASSSITLNAGDFARTNTIVSVKVPGLSAGTYSLSGAEVGPLQVDGQENGTFVITKMAKGATAKLAIKPAKPQEAVMIGKHGSQLKLTPAGKSTALLYQMEPSEVPSPDIPAVFRHGAHLHAFTPSGKQVTGDYPADHRWHRGIWLGWTDTDFEGRHPDFWNMGKDKGKLTGEVRFASLAETWSGPVHAGFTGRHAFIDHTSGEEKPVLNETWTARSYVPQGKANLFDLESVQTCAGEVPLKLPKYYYGGLGFRANPQWEEKDVFTVLTSDGETDRVKANDAPCRWVALGGKVDGEPCALVIFCHPENFRAPQPVRVNPKNPQTCHAPSIGGDWEITPGKPYVSRYRFVVLDGVAEAAEMERLWNDYATPPVARAE